MKRTISLMILALLTAGAMAQERFVAPLRYGAAATLELRPEVTVNGTEIKLKQIARWSDEDARTLAPLADLVVLRLGTEASFQTVEISEVKNLLQEAGINLGLLRFTGAMSCRVKRSDVTFDERAALQQWMDTRGGQSAAARTTEMVPALAIAQSKETVAVTSTLKTDPFPATQTALVQANAPQLPLREQLRADLCTRLGLSPDDVQIQFNPEDDKHLNLSGPVFAFQIQPRRVKNLGEVCWDVTIIAPEIRRKVPVVGIARAWQNQLVTTRPLGYRQVIRGEDVAERRVLVDMLTDEALLNREQVIGQQTARDTSAGAVLTARMVEAVPLVKSGQLVTVLLGQGGVQITTVARAMENGVYGQSVRVRNETTRDVFEVVVTGPQTGRLGPASSGGTKVAAAER